MPVDRKTKARFQARAEILKALAHPTRLFIVDELSREERCVCELTEKIGADVSTVSKHLAILRNVGVVEDDKRGTKVFYRLRVPCVLDFFSCVESILSRRAKDQLRVLR
jgi:ArsR family transcriptional regulator